MIRELIVELINEDTPVRRRSPEGSGANNMLLKKMLSIARGLFTPAGLASLVALGLIYEKETTLKSLVFSGELVKSIVTAVDTASKAQSGKRIYTLIRELGTDATKNYINYIEALNDIEDSGAADIITTAADLANTHGHTDSVTTVNDVDTAVYTAMSKGESLELFFNPELFVYKTGTRKLAVAKGASDEDMKKSLNMRLKSLIENDQQPGAYLVYDSAMNYNKLVGVGGSRDPGFGLKASLGYVNKDIANVANNAISNMGTKLADGAKKIIKGAIADIF